MDNGREACEMYFLSYCFTCTCIHSPDSCRYSYLERRLSTFHFYCVLCCETECLTTSHCSPSLQPSSTEPEPLRVIISIRISSVLKLQSFNHVQPALNSFRFHGPFVKLWCMQSLSSFLVSCFAVHISLPLVN